MKRRAFVQQCTLLAAAGSMTAIAQDALKSGVSRLSKEKNFTIYHAGLVPAYKVGLGEVVLVECQHGLPGLVTRDGTFREAKEGDPVNPGTGPIYNGRPIAQFDLVNGRSGFSNRSVWPFTSTVAESRAMAISRSARASAAMRKCFHSSIP